MALGLAADARRAPGVADPGAGRRADHGGGDHVPRAARVLQRVDRLVQLVECRRDGRDHDGLTMAGERVLEQSRQLRVAVRHVAIATGWVSESIDAVAEG